MAICQAKTAAGTPCARPALAGSKFCFGHDPEKKKARAALATKSATSRTNGTTKRKYVKRKVNDSPEEAFMIILHHMVRKIVIEVLPSVFAESLGGKR